MGNKTGTFKSKLDNFLNSRRLQTHSQWIKFEYGKVYIHLQDRLLPQSLWPEKYSKLVWPCLVIANVEIKSAVRGRGLFREVLQLCFDICEREGWYLCVESVGNQRLAEHLRENRWVMESEGWLINNWYRSANYEQEKVHEA